MEYKYRFTIFTPCYNSEKFIHRVFESLQQQTFRDFEWLVINDASTDGTLKILENYGDKANFPMRIINNERNMMVYYNYNLAFDEAQGELMVFAGHDDRMDNNTLDIFNNIWKKYGQLNIAGIWCHCRNQKGEFIGRKFKEDVFVSNYFKIFFKYIYKNEKFGCTRTDILKQHKFDIENGFDSEGFLWAGIADKYDTIYTNNILRTYYVEKENLNALTKQGRIKTGPPTYKGYKIWINKYLRKTDYNFYYYLRFHFAFCFHGIIVKNNFNEVLKDADRITSKIAVLTMYLFARALYGYKIKKNTL